jgi:hypothetical protein
MTEDGKTLETLLEDAARTRARSIVVRRGVRGSRI